MAVEVPARSSVGAFVIDDGLAILNVVIDLTRTSIVHTFLRVAGLQTV